MFRLVTADVAFYTGNLQALKGLKDLDLNMAEIWEQKRWWHPGKLGIWPWDVYVYKGNIGCLRFKNWTWNPKWTGGGEGEKESISVGKLGFSVIYKECLVLCFLQWGVADQVSITFLILSGNRLRFLWTKSKRTHSCNTAVAD